MPLKPQARNTVLLLRRTRAPMGAPAHRVAPAASGDVTLLELVQAISDVTDDEREIVATVMYMLRSGHARLIGNFRDEPIEDF